jgi:TRAP-type uncharacterized transport system substrate-binding protein
MKKCLPVFILLLLLGACSGDNHSLRMHALDSFRADPELIQEILEQQTRLTITDAEVNLSLSATEMLTENQADLTLVENSVPFQTGVRAILPVYKSALHLLIRDGVDMWQDEQPLRGKEIHIAGGSVTGNRFVELAASRMGLSATDYKLVEQVTPGQTDLIVYFGPIDTANTRWFVEGYHLEPLGMKGEESAMAPAAIGYLIPQLKPFSIPAGTYQLPGGEKTLGTVAVTTLLATRKSAPVDTIYELTKVLLEEKPRFVKVSSALFSGINDSFDPLDLNFPLHRGARRYLNRDEPSTIERYAETINLLVYLIFLLLTGVIGFTRYRARRKKDRIDTYYARVLDIRKRAANQANDQSLLELRQLEEEAFEALIAEKLAADESFRIFIELASRTATEIEQR